MRAPRVLFLLLQEIEDQVPHILDVSAVGILKQLGFSRGETPLGRRRRFMVALPARQFE